MARIKIDLPAAWHFTIDLPVRITDINYGQHLGNDSFLSLLQEARVRWLRQYGWTELIDHNTGLMMVDIAVRLKAEAVFGDTLRIHIATAEWTSFGFDILYLVTKAGTTTEVARAKTGMVFFDYSAKRIAAVPENFQTTVERAPAGT